MDRCRLRRALERLCLQHNDKVDPASFAEQLLDCLHEEGYEVSEQVAAPLLERVFVAQAASCTCGTKTSEQLAHRQSCRYRVLGEAAEEIQRLNKQIADLHLARANRGIHDAIMPRWPGALPGGGVGIGGAMNKEAL